MNEKNLKFTQKLPRVNYFLGELKILLIHERMLRFKNSFYKHFNVKRIKFSPYNSEYLRCGEQCIKIDKFSCGRSKVFNGKDVESTKNDIYLIIKTKKAVYEC